MQQIGLVNKRIIIMNINRDITEADIGAWARTN